MPRACDILYKNQPFTAPFCGVVELAFRWRYTLAILESVVRSKQTNVDRRPLNLGKKHPSGLAVACGEILKEEHLEVLAEKLIASDVVAQRLPFRRELLLHTADEYALLHNISVPTSAGR